MSLIKKLKLENFFTKEEITILLFLLFFTFLGVSIKLYRSLNPPEYQSFQFEKTDIDSILVAVFSTEKVENLSLNQTKQKREPLQKKSINLNTATVEELTRLPGIGEKTAEKIVEYRSKYGMFRRIEDIMKIERIGENTFEKIKDYITVTK